MPDNFTELIESFTAAEASIQSLFNRDHDGVGIRTLIKRGGPKYATHLAEAAKFIGEVFDRRRPMWQLKEALSTDDFPLLFGDTIDRLMLAKYKAAEPVFGRFMKVTRNIRDFREVKRFRCSIGAGLTDEVGPGGDYHADAPTEAFYTFAVKKYGRRRDILWEALVNDDLDALQSAPDDLAKQAINRESHFASSNYVANTTLYGNHSVAGTVYANRFTLTLTAQNLATVLGAMGDFPGDDADGTPIVNDPIYLVVGTREMQFQAEQILNSVVVVQGTDQNGKNLATANIIPPDLRNRMQVIFDPFMRLHDPTNYKKSWYLFCDPNDGWAVEIGYLIGHDTPELYMKAANQIRLGAGAAIEGDFDTDARSYKALHVIGGSHTNAVGGWRFTAWSDGTT